MVTNTFIEQNYCSSCCVGLSKIFINIKGPDELRFMLFKDEHVIFLENRGNLVKENFTYCVAGVYCKSFDFAIFVILNT